MTASEEFYFIAPVSGKYFARYNIVWPTGIVLRDWRKPNHVVYPKVCDVTRCDASVA